MTINFNIGDDKANLSTTTNQNLSENLPSPVVLDASFLEESETDTPAPQSFEQENFSLTSGEALPSPESFENDQSIGNDLIPSPVEIENMLGLEATEGNFPEPMSLDEIDDSKTPTTKKSAKTTKSSTKK